MEPELLMLDNFAGNDYIIATFDVGAWYKSGLEFYYFKKKKKIKICKNK